MRSFFAKIIFCMLLVPILARSGGLLLNATLSDPRPIGERTIAAIVPVVSNLIERDLRDGHRVVVSGVLSSSGGVVRLETNKAACANVHSPDVAASVAGTDDCVVMRPVPRPLLFGVVPASWWFVMPALELLCCIVVSTLLARYLSEPIRRTRAAATAFAAGDMSARAGRLGFRRRHDEAADLAREFDRMADRVSAMIAAQRRFIGDVSHEIRSPLARLSLALGLARRGAGPDLTRHFDRMEQEIDAMSRLVRELLALASLQGTTEPARLEAIDLSTVADLVVDDMTFEFRERAQAIRVLRRPGPVWVRGDAALLRRAFENVLRNALFYTPDDTQVEMILERDAHAARLVVRDHGPGVPETALPNLFRPFFRVDEARARATGGVGLGLAITHRAIELHGGRITAENVRPHGLAVRIELPTTEAPQPETEIELRTAA